MFLNWQKYNIDVPSTRNSGNYKTTCPACRDNRGNPHDKSLSCNLATGQFNCHHCGWSGSVAEEEDWEKQQRKQNWYNTHPIKRQRKTYKKPEPKPQSPYSAKLLAYMASRGISEATLQAVKVGEGIEPMPRKNGKPFGNMNTIQFNYYRCGELVNIKYRTGEKMFKLVQDAELLPYNIDSIKGETTCIITEGEFDTLAFVEAGYKAVVSVPNGANSNLEWLDDYQDDYFEDKQIIYIASDNDTKGVELQAELLRRFGVERCRVVDYGDGCKDANEHLVKYGKESLRECITNAREIPITGAFNVTDIEQQADELYYKGMQKGATIGHPFFDELCSFKTGMLAIVTGIPNHGKSEFLDEIIYRLNLRYKWRWAYFSPENEPLELHAAKLIEKYTGKKFGHTTLPVGEYTAAKQRLATDYYFIAPEDNYRLDNILSKARSLVRKYGIRGLVIDPYNYIETDQQPGQSKTEYVSEMLTKLKTFAKINDVLVFLVAHPAKMQKNKQGQYEAPTLYDISDSAHFNNKADYGISIFRRFADDDTWEGTEAHVLKVRFKHLGHRGTAYFKYNTINGRYVTVQQNQSDNVPWDNSNHLVKSLEQAALEAANAAKLDFGDSDDDPDDDNLDFDNENAPY